MKGYYYTNSRNREVLHVFNYFSVENCARKGPQVTLDLSTLQRRQKIMRNGRVSLNNLVEVDVEEEDLDIVATLCFDGRISEAEGYCVDIFDHVANRRAGIE